jgi:hypothetical protein
LNSIQSKELKKKKLENIKNLKTKYEKLTNRDEIKKYEVLIEEHFEQIDQELGRKLPYKYFSLKSDYEEIKKKKKFLNFQSVQCSSQENMTYYTRTRKMESRSELVSLHKRRVTYQEFEFDFPVCSVCRKKISRLKITNFLGFIILLGWIIGFVGMAGYIAFFSIGTNELPTIYIIIAAVGAFILIIGLITLRFLKYWPRRFVKIDMKYRGHTAFMRGKNYEGIPMVKPADSKKWISYESCVKSVRLNY